MQKTTEHGNYQYGYDKAYRLKSAINPTLDNEAYTYDKVGNRLTSASTTGNWTYDNSDQLLSTPSDTYEYTANGNTKKITPSDTTQKASEYIYNARDRLAEVKKDNVSLQKNRYDFQQRRIVKTTAGGETYFLYGETGLIAEYQSNGDFIQGYGYYPNTSYTTNTVYTLKQSGGNYQADFYHNDHLATPQKLTNSTGAVSWAMESNAFGETTIKTQTITNNLRFPGQYGDSEIGLNQNYYRDYAPSLGRYVESDPIGLKGGFNIYIYSNNLPIVNIDNMGLKARVCCRTIPGLRLILNARHCYIEVIEFWGGARYTYGVIGHNADGSPNGGPTSVQGRKHVNNGFDSGGICGPWRVKDTCDGSDVDNCVKKAYNAYPNPSIYRFVSGPNSNTFAGTVARSCSLKKPPGRLLTPGYDDPPASPYINKST